MSRHLVAAVLGLALAAGCNTETAQPDGRVDKGSQPGILGGPCYPNSTCNQGLICRAGTCAVGDAGVDGATDKGPDGPTAPCATPGKSCTLADPCALDPVCGADHVCRAAKMQRCDDGLSCTTDSCKPMGLCEHTPLPKTCVLPTVVVGKPKLRCFAEGERDPADACHECAPATSATSWSPANSGACDDGDPCTKNDYCQAGVCGGTPYGGECDDGLSCTDDQCDGKGSCLGNKLQSTSCLINKVCYVDRAGDVTGCNVCDVSKSQSAWTPLVGGCTIGGLCYKAGARDPLTGCSICDPATSKTAWTPLAPGSFCTIVGTCYLKAETSAGGCGVCDPAQSATAWTVTGANCLINDVCYSSGQVDVTGCGTCDPTKSKTAWTTLPNTCLIGGKCVTKGAAGPPPCTVCDPLLSSTSWTVVGSACLINDTCYTPGQPDPVTSCGSCDPTKSKTAWTPIANTCLINGKCFTKGAVGITPCGVCDPQISPTSWTIVGSACLINDACYTTGQLDPVTGCGSCDPTKSKTAWTPALNKCLIGGVCYKDLDPNPKTSCLICKVATDPSGWTPVAGIKSTVYTFEDGKTPPTGWTITNSDPKVGWVVSQKRPGAGSYSLYYGDPVAGNYAGSGANSGSAKLPPITLTAGKKSGLSFLLYLDTESGSAYDKLQVFVGATMLWEKDAPSPPPPTPPLPQKSWQSVTVDLSAYAGQTITIELKFDTSDAISNSTEGVYVDNVTIYDGC